MHSEGKARVALFFWEGYLGVAPSMINAAIRVFSEHGYLVDVITRYSRLGYPPPPDFSEGVRILKLRPVSLWMQKQPSLSIHAGTRTNSNLVQAAKFLLRGFKKLLWHPYRWFCILGDHLQFAAFSLHCTKGYRYTCFIGVDRDGLVIATLAGALRRVPIIYWSLELRFLSEFRDPLERLLKSIERFCNRRSVFTVIQDWERANSLVAENKIDSSSITIVPNGPLGPPCLTKSNYFQQKFGLAPSCKIILSIGMIHPAVLSLELAEAASGWPDDWVLILHERAKRDNSDPYLKRIQEVGQGHIRLSLDPVPYDELDDIVRSAHIGVVLYQKELGSNFAQMGGASGKLAHYLRCGVPVVCIDLPGFREAIGKYQCAVYVRDITETTKAIQTIFGNYNFYGLNAIKCYEEVYEFGTHFKQVIRQIEHLSER